MEPEKNEEDDQTHLVEYQINQYSHSLPEVYSEVRLDFSWTI